MHSKPIFMFRILIVFFILLYSSLLTGQEVKLDNLQADYMTKFDRYSVESGLSNNRCLSVFQDRFGYLWIGTENGLNRFDGHEFVHYMHDTSDSLSITGNFISGISEDINGNLWIATHSGLNLFNRSTETFQRFLKQENKNSLRDNHVRAILADSIYLWIETLDGTLSKLNLETQLFEHFKHPKITQPYYSYHSIFKDTDGEIWVGGRNMGPCKFNPQTELFSCIEPGDLSKGKKRDRDVASYFIDHNNNFWVSATDGIYQYNKTNNQFKRVLGTSTFSIKQDKNQNLWFGTGSGVIKYDYKNQVATLFAHDENNQNSLSNNHVNEIYEDREGNIWVATEKGLNKLSVVKNKFGHIYHIPENQNSLASNKVTSIAEDQNGNLWIGYEDKGFDKYNVSTQSFENYNTETHPELRSNRVSTLYFDSDNQLWIGLWQGVGFHKLNPETNRIKHYAYDPDSRKRDWYNDFLEDSNNNFWVGFWGSSGLHLFNRSKEKFEPDHFRPVNKPLEQNITALASDNEYIWIGSNNGLIYSYNHTTKEYNAHTHGEFPYCEFDRLHSHKLFPFRVTHEIIVDHINRKWFITDRGIILFNPLTNLFTGYPFPSDQDVHLINSNKNVATAWFNANNQLLKFNFNTKEFEVIKLKSNKNDFRNIKFVHQTKSNQYLITENEIFNADVDFKNLYSIKEFKDSEIDRVFYDDNRVWIFHGDKVLIYNNDFSKIIHESANVDLPEAEIYTLLRQGQTIWIGTDNGLYQVIDDKRIVHFCTDENSSENIISEQILSITEDVSHNLWIGTDKGLCLFDSTKKTFTAVNQPNANSLTSHLISVLLEDSFGNIWIGTTNKGLNRLNPETRKIQHFTFSPTDSFSISNNKINCIFEDKQKNLWVGTDFGLNLLQTKSDRFLHFTTKNGLAGNKIQSIIQDDAGHIWIGTDNGCSVYDVENAEFKNYYQSDGLQSNQFTNAAIKLSSGKIVLGGEKGINIFDPAQLAFIYPETAVQITGFKVFDKTLHADFTDDKNVILNYKENFFSINFSALNYSNPQQYSYLYKLSGVDPNWVVAKENMAEYTDIRPGNYVFSMKSVSPDGNESKIKQLEIIIKPPFWKTWWFYALTSLLVLSIISWIILLRINKLKAQKENALLEQKLLRSQMNPHFIFNALFSIQNYIYSKDTENADRFLTKFARLLRLILENSRTATISIDDELQTITNYLDLQKLRFDEKFNYSIVVDPKIDKDEMMIPPMLAQPFIENAIEHGFYEKEKSYHINISIWLVNKNIIYIIEDDGIGIEKSKQFKDLQRKEHKSLGMKITNERLLNLKKITKQKIKIDVTDLSKENKQGTRVIFTIPLK